MKLHTKIIQQAIQTAEQKDYFKRLQRIYETIPQGSCTGCTKCCMESVHTHFIEFLNIWNYLKQKPVLCKRIFSSVVRYYFYEMVEKKHCPFLDDEGSCLIYEVRPLVCRLFGHMTEEEYEQNYKNVLKDNIHVMKNYKNHYHIQLPKEVVEYKIDYCKNFQVDKKMPKSQRQSIADTIFTMESQFFMRGLITESFLNIGLVSWFVYTLEDQEKMGQLRLKVIKEDLEYGESKTFDEWIKNIKIPF